MFSSPRPIPCGHCASTPHCTPSPPIARTSWSIAVSAPPTLGRKVSVTCRTRMGRGCNRCAPAREGTARRLLLHLRLEVPDRHLPGVFELELVRDLFGLLARGAGFDGQVPAEQVVRTLVANVRGVLAQLGGRLHQAHA